MENVFVLVGRLKANVELTSPVLSELLVDGEVMNKFIVGGQADFSADFQSLWTKERLGIDQEFVSSHEVIIRNATAEKDSRGQ
ncbi:hypothetical protein MRY87_01685 [bacterium]|nr:hypothetical protein [bacterium]